jgi:ATP-dependent protease ClpP protease subunit
MALIVPTTYVAAQPDEISVVAYDRHTIYIEINGMITEKSFMEFVEVTKYAENQHFNLIIHTNGGDAWSTVGIINRMHELKERGCTFTTTTYAKAFSAGAYLWLEGDNRVIYEGATLMFHTIMQQATKAQVDMGREMGSSRAISAIERLDAYIAKRFKKITDGKLSEGMQNFYLYGNTEGPDVDSEENGQYMSAETARNVELATEYKGLN